MLQLFIVFALISSTFATCANDGIEFQNSCYYFQSNVSAFVNAEQACVKLGGHLASIHDGFSNAFIAQQASLLLHDSTIADIWIGATDLINPGNYTWTDGSVFKFSEWQGNKTVLGEDCGALDLSEGRWLMQDCFKQKAYACKVEPFVANTTTTPFPRTTTAIPSYYDCGSDWIYYAPTTSCYGKVTKKSFNDAEIYCQKYNAHLVSIHRYSDLEFVSTLQRMIDNDLWIGLYANNDPQYKNEWYYTDGTDVDLDIWADKLPNKNNLCGYIKNSDDDAEFYNDRWCSNEIAVICEKKVTFN